MSDITELVASIQGIKSAHFSDDGCFAFVQPFSKDMPPAYIYFKMRDGYRVGRMISVTGTQPIGVAQDQPIGRLDSLDRLAGSL
jgi:hypothetical protein